MQGLAEVVGGVAGAEAAEMAPVAALPVEVAADGLHLVLDAAGEVDVVRTAQAAITDYLSA